jgi:hypothetical protein
MKEKFVRIICLITIILVVAATGCVAPPKDNKTSSTAGNFFNPGQTNPDASATTTPNYVTDVTPFVTVTSGSGYRTIPATTQLPEDKYCRIYTTKNTYAFNKTAIAFDLQSPPMYINYTVKPSNITKKIAYTSKITGEGDKVITVDTYSPDSWYEIIVRSKSTGEIYLQDGFGTRKGYSEYLSRNLKILKRDNMQIEFSGSNITATAMVWVKPSGNINDTTQFNMTTDCAYFDYIPRDSVPFVTATPRPTWTG